MKKFHTLIFDLDGVLIDSKNNMKNSWNSVRKELKVKQSFKKYFTHIGYPFEKILNKMGIKKNITEIKKLFKKKSILNIRHIKIYKGVHKALHLLKSNGINVAIVTSKDINRTKIMVKKLRIPIKILISPRKNIRGKPYPDQLNLALKKLKSPKKGTAYIGDMPIDYNAAINTKIDFIFAQYGYGIKKKQYGKVIKKPMDILKFI